MNFKSRSLNIYGENMNAVSVQTSRQWSYISGKLKSWCFVPRQANWERPAWPTRTARKRLKTAGVWIAHQMTTAAQRFRASASAKMASYKSDCCSAVIVSKLLLFFDPPWSTRSRRELERSSAIAEKPRDAPFYVLFHIKSLKFGHMSRYIYPLRFKLPHSVLSWC